ncbi:MAG: TonB-dependent receptor [Gemmatimonadota bacterium]
MNKSLPKHLGAAWGAAAALLLALPAAAVAQDPGVVQGVIMTATTGPAADVTVRIVGQDRSVVSGADGRFRFDDVRPGSHLLEARDERLGQGSERVTVEPGETVEVEILLSPLFVIDALVVTAGPLASRQDELFQAARVVGGRELRDRLQPSLGETLADEPGLSSTYFGPGSSRPVIRGLGGDRVRVLENGVGTGDASNTSPDHAVSVDPATAERIEVVRGPATLLYGISAIGGVVNVLDVRVPHERPSELLVGEFLATGGTVADEKALSGHLVGALGPVVVRGSGSWRDTRDYNIPGYPDLDEAEAIAEGQEPGLLENSGTENTSVSLGASWLGGRGYLGVAVTGYDQLYGVPGHGHHDDEEPVADEEEAVRVDLRQRRLDLHGELRFGTGLFEALRLRVGGNDYEHVELEGSAVGTRFTNDQWEGRLEARHRTLGIFQGAVGLQGSTRDFAAIGDEAFTPPSNTDLLAAFAYEEADVGSARFQLGGRVEWQRSSESVDDFSESFFGMSLSTGVRWDLSDPVSLSLAGSRSVKLPTAEELFSDGPHLATRSYEVGDRDLSKEVAWSVDATLHVHWAELRGEVSAFYNAFDGYIYPAFSGNVREGLEEVIYSQADARFLGLEARGEFELFHRGEHHLGVEVQGDWVRATLVDADQPLPRIPPLRLSAGLRYEGQPAHARLTVRRVTEQDRVAAFEDPTPGYTMLDASAGYRLFVGWGVHEIVLQARNLTDVDARNHVSLLKETVPLPGRDLRLMYRVAF